MGYSSAVPSKPSTGIEVQVLKSVAVMFVQQEDPTLELKQQGEIFEPYLMDISQPVEELDILLTSEKQDLLLLEEEKVQQGSKDLQGAHIENEFDACATD